MEFRTITDLPKGMPVITHQHKMLMMGSCFAENIGELLVKHKFNCDVNPYGILYNPLSIATAFRQILTGTFYTDKDLFFYGDQYHSYMHHGAFSSNAKAEVLQRINNRLQRAHKEMAQQDYLLITWGTAWVYTLNDTGKVVANCHKLPSKMFNRRRLHINEIVEEYALLLKMMLEQNPTLKVVMTVSPIRHLKDGVHENQLSKATLLLAAAQLQALFPNSVYYFPSYEIVIDELRDYRFYADDMVHPSNVAIDYIWKCFGKLFFSAETKETVKEVEAIVKALTHKPFDECSEGYKCFLQQIVLKIERLKEKYPYLDVQKELDLCHTRLK